MASKDKNAVRKIWEADFEGFELPHYGRYIL